MNSLLSERLKLDVALGPASLSGANTGQYFRLDGYRKGLFVVTIGAMVAAATSALQVMQATGADGGGPAKAVDNLTATITANTHVAVATLTLNNVQVGDTVTINGLTYTAAAVADLPNRVFSQGGTDDVDAASLAAAINHATAGVPGVLAEANAAVVTLTAIEPGDRDITVTAGAATITPATVRAVAYLEVDASMLDVDDDFTHVGLKVTNSAAMITGAVLVRGFGRYTPVQYVAAADTAV